MKIVTASKFYYHRAGLESYLFKITNTLRQNSHEVIPFSTNYKLNYKTDYDEFFAEYIELGGEERVTLYKKIKALGRIFYNFEARNKFSLLLDYTHPDIVWGFGVHRHLSPSIFVEAQKRGIPVIHRLSDYAIICPDSRLTRGNDKICTEIGCPKKGYHNAIKHRCVRLTKGEDGKKASITASVIGAAELAFHNKFRFYVNNVNKFIAPSNFLRKVMISSGIPEEKITHIPIYIDSKNFVPGYKSEPYLVYFGRLNWEKGLPLLLEAMGNLKHFKLLILGAGPERSNLEEIKERKNLVNVEFAGKLYGDGLYKVIKNSRAVVIPSIWYDNSPNVILESFALGKPVIGADLGGIPEYINEGEDGLLYQYDNVDELSEQINYLMMHPELSEEMGYAARKKVEEVYNPEKHYEQVSNTFKELTNGKTGEMELVK